MICPLSYSSISLGPSELWWYRMVTSDRLIYFSRFNRQPIKQSRTHGLFFTFRKFSCKIHFSRFVGSYSSVNSHVIRSRVKQKAKQTKKAVITFLDFHLPMLNRHYSPVVIYIFFSRVKFTFYALVPVIYYDHIITILWNLVHSFMLNSML